MVKILSSNYLSFLNLILIFLSITHEYIIYIFSTSPSILSNSPHILPIFFLIHYQVF